MKKKTLMLFMALVSATMVSWAQQSNSKAAPKKSSTSTVQAKDSKKEAPKKSSIFGENTKVLASQNPRLDKSSPMKASVKLRMRASVDFAFTDADEEKEYDNIDNWGAYIPEVRLGASGRYGQWSGKVDVGMTAGQVSLKDVFISYSINKANYLTVGYFIPRMGLNGSTSSTTKPTFQDPLSTHMFGDRRAPGLSFVHEKDQFYVAGILHTENAVMKNPVSTLGNMGWGFMATFDWRPQREKGKIFQVGISMDWSTPTYNKKDALNHTSFTFYDIYPFSTSEYTIINCGVADAKNRYKFAPEVQIARGKFAFEGQYYHMFITRDEKYDMKLNTYYATGFYGSFRWMMKGTGFVFDEASSGIETPGNGEMEFVLGYNYMDMSDHNSYNKIDGGYERILGGKSHDFSLTWNYYINKHVIWRIRGSWTKALDRGNCTPLGVALSEKDHFPKDLAIWGIQTRLQIKF